MVETCTLDALGRVVIPKNICRTVGIGPHSPLSITLFKNEFIFEKHEKNVSRFKRPIGIVRRLDKLDRFVIPKEYIQELDVKAGQIFTAELNNETITLKIPVRLY